MNQALPSCFELPAWRAHLPGKALLLVTIATLLAAGTVYGQEQQEPSNFDARVTFNEGFEVRPSPAQRQAEQALRDSVPGLAVSYDRTSGVARKIHTHAGYLTEPSTGDPRTIAIDFVNTQRELLGLSSEDLLDYVITDSVFSRATGATHLYLRQIHQDILVYDGQLHVNINRDGRILSVNNSFSPSLARAANAARPVRDAPEAVLAAVEHLGSSSPPPVVLEGPSGPQQITRMSQPLASWEEIVAELVWLPIRAGQVRLAWNFQLHTPDGQHIYDFTVDARTGEVWTRFDWVDSAEYRVYEQPVESPQHTTPLPPADARTLAVDPADATASPLGWHDTGTSSYTIMRGNNVHAYDDRDGNNLPPIPEPSCGAALSCDFPLDLSSDPVNSIPAAVANLFYWINVVHDVEYQYGFDEAAGNFQADNFGKGGVGNDDVQAEAQDNASGGSNCNAFFTTGSDGVRPRMRIFVCNHTNPPRDGNFDAGVIVHEYGHGISNRLVGGPSNVNCLQNVQQPGEGWSDWLALVYTAEPGDLSTDPRGVGSYLFGLSPDDTIRDLPYSTDPAVNNWTYESIQGASVPHGVGSRWAQALWKVYWALVDKHGLDPDLYDAAGGSGNQRTLLYVNEGMKNTACSPSFLDARDGVVNAATDNFGGEDLCTVWEAFADFGLGVDATTAGPNSLTAANGFALPSICEKQKVYDSFAGANGSPLNGRTTEVGGRVWQARPDAILNNSVVTTADVFAAAGVPLDPGATSLITIAADVDPTGSSWCGVGFANSPTGVYWNAGEIWALLRPNGTYTIHADGTSIILGSGTIPGAATNGFHHVEIRYDTVTRLVTAEINGTEVVSAQQLPAPPNIQYAGFHLRIGTLDVTRLDNFNVRVEESSTRAFDSFVGVNGSPLNGRTTEVGAEVWQARPDAILNNGVVTPADVFAAAGIPLDPGATSLITIAADVDPTGSSWCGVGFANSPTGVYWNAGEIWALLRPNGTYTIHADGTSIILGSGAIPGAATNGFHHVEIRYDTVTRLVTAAINGIEVVSAQQLPAPPNIQYAGFHLRIGTLDVTRLDNFNVRVEESSTRAFDSFVGVNASPLDGRTTEVGAEVWQARPDAILNNGVVTPADVFAAAGIPLDPGATSLITIAADVDPTGSSWCGVGFANSPTGVYWNAGEVWALLRPNGTYTIHADGTAIILGSGTIPGAATNGFHHVEIRYDTVTRLVTAAINGTEVVSAQQLPAPPNIQYAGFHLRIGTLDVTRLDNFNVLSEP